MAEQIGETKRKTREPMAKSVKLNMKLIRKLLKQWRQEDAKRGQ